MSNEPDAELLEQFARNQSEAAFAALVRRHIALVHSVASRHRANPQQAEDITQAVFIILARKAASLGPKTVLPGWLYHTARLTAANLQRAETRRIRREQEAFMQSTLEESANDIIWRELSPLLDDVMSDLRATDRDAIVLRFFKNQSLADVGAAMGIAERAAQKRVNRALEKLRAFFSKRGIVSTTSIIAGVISANSVQAAPPALANSVTAAAIAKGATASTSTLTLIKGALKLMAWSKIQTSVAIGVALIVAVGTTTVIINKARMENRTSDLPSLTLNVNPNLFITNIMKQAEETMNTPLSKCGDVLMDMLRMQGVDCDAPRDIAFDSKTGKITIHNTPDAFEKIRQTVEELNQADGRCDFFSRLPLQQEILFNARFYKMSHSDFEALGLRKPDSAETRTESAWWMLDPKRLNEIKQNLQSHEIKPFQQARIDTGYGVEAILNVEANLNAEKIELACLPIAPINTPSGKKEMIDFKIAAYTTGVFTSNPAGDWSNFANRTNCALFAEANIEDGGTLIFHAENPAQDDLMVLLHVNIKAKK